MPVLTKADSDLIALAKEGDFITDADALDLTRHIERTGQNAALSLVQKAILSDQHVGLLLSHLYELPFIRLTHLKIEKSLLDLIPSKIAEENEVVPFRMEGETLLLATSQPNQEELFALLEKKTKKKIKIFVAPFSEVRDALRAYQPPLTEKLKIAVETIAKKGEKEGAEAISLLLEDIIATALSAHASDIHIEPQKNEIIVRMRLDGVLKDILTLPKSFQEVLISRVKVLANLRTDEHRAAQDGRISMDFPSTKLSLRVSIIPIQDGEKVVLRLLASQTALNLEGLGYSPDQLQILRETMQKSHGMILVTGPTGCGKTTTLYSMLRMLNSREVNITTIEDPVEIRLPGANQIQVNTEANLTFASGLRSILRQDPNIILVGEIRDLETAHIAVNAALTGHIVFATLHTNDAASTLPRLLEMGVEHFLVASTVNVVVAQRLVRRLCPFCMSPQVVPLQKLLDLFKPFPSFDSEHLLKMLAGKGGLTGDSQVTAYESKGCEACHFSGYSGRVAIAEFLPVDQGVRQLITGKTLANDIVKEARKKGMMTMMEDGLLKVLQGLTTKEEVLRVTRE